MKRLLLIAILIFSLSLSAQATMVSVCGMPSSKTVQVRVYSITDTAETVAWTSTGVTERANGQGKSCYYYAATLTAGKEYQIDWKDNSSSIKTAGEVINLTATNVDTTVSSRGTSTYAGGAVASVTAGVTVTTNNDKTGYALTAAYDPAKTTAQALTALSNATWTDTKAGYLDAAVSSRSTLTAQQVWEYVSRTLTEAGSTLTAQEVWEYATRELTGKTGFELSAAYDAAKTASQFNASTDTVNANIVSKNTDLDLSETEIETIWDIFDNALYGAQLATSEDLSDTINAIKASNVILNGDFSLWSYEEGNTFPDYWAVTTEGTTQVYKSQPGISSPAQLQLNVDASNSLGQIVSFPTYTTTLLSGTMYEFSINYNITSGKTMLWSFGREGVKWLKDDGTWDDNEHWNTLTGNGITNTLKFTFTTPSDSTIYGNLAIKNGDCASCWVLLDDVSIMQSSKITSSQSSVDAIPINPLLTTDPRLDNLDVAISSRSTLTAQQVWEYVTRTLTDSGLTAQDVWEYATRELTGKTGFELSAAYDAAKTAASQSSVDTISVNLLRGLGLMMENHVEDDIVRNSKGLKTSSKFYLYDSKAHAVTHDKATGLIATYTVSVSYSSQGAVTLFKVVRD